MSPLHLARGKTGGNIQRQIQREMVSSWIPLGLFMREMKSWYNTGMILALPRRDNFWTTSFTEYSKSRTDWQYLEACSSLRSALSTEADAVVCSIKGAWPQLLNPDFCSSEGARHLTRPPPRTLTHSFILKVKSDHRLQILMHSAPETSGILHR